MFSGISIWQLVIILVIVVLLFGTKKLRNMGSDVGGAVKGFKNAMKDGEEEQKDKQSQKQVADNGDSFTIDRITVDRAPPASSLAECRDGWPPG